MKILHIIPYYFLHWSNLPVELVYEMTHALFNRGNDVTIFTTNVFNKRNALRKSAVSIYHVDGISIFEFNSIINFFGLNFSPNMRTYLSDMIQNFDIIHLHEYPTYQNLLIAEIAKKKNVPYIIQAHASLSLASYPFFPRTMRMSFDMMLGKKIMQNACLFFALNNTEVVQYLRIGVPCDRIRLVPNGINFSEYAHLPPKGLFRKRYCLSESENIVLYVGRLDHTKRIDLLIKAFSLLKNKINNSKLVIVGKDYGVLSSLKKIVWRLHLDHDVIFTGFLSKDVKIEAMTDSDVFVTPCFYGFPHTFLEACACGLPIITTEEGDYLSWINEKTGLVTNFDEYSLYLSIYTIMTNHELKFRLSNNCRRLVKEQFDWNVIAKRLEKNYAEAHLIHESV